MEEVVCSLCHKRISMLQAATGHVLTVNGNLVHLACSQDLTIAEVEAKSKQTN
jgi:hypothetical protein